jgi:hypothetical protein
MKISCVVAVTVLVAGSAFAQSKLANEHDKLTSDCKSVRGHAHRIVEEASVMDLNVDVARAHAGQVVKSLQSMEERLRTAKTIMTAAQQKQVAAEQKLLEEACKRLQAVTKKIEAELSNDAPDRLQIRKWAMEMRDEMTKSSEIHRAMKKKLGL